VSGKYYGQEAIQMMDGDYLATLVRMVADGKARNDPTLAIALSVGALDKLVSEVLAARIISKPDPRLREALERVAGAARGVKGNQQADPVNIGAMAALFQALAALDTVRDEADR